jgi:pheromone shutdown protein TraB
VKGERFQLSLSEVPTEQQVVPLIRLLKTRYPRPHKVLVHERNVHMVKALQKYHADFPHQTILVVIGMGHLPGMRKLLEAQQE